VNKPGYYIYFPSMSLSLSHLSLVYENAVHHGKKKLTFP